ncbi:hypothetical protein GIB67_032703 [Kingdonia uniflora]|uniref:Receptor-like serine/threonine-protein kinase n=1 Tax=Kingdonia uniflora TaxID=39325 RepID=A0A7J7MW39_9MAGN|nr:hypothetical protein GIB67_032703 [Kingdonia uniflora]
MRSILFWILFSTLHPFFSKFATSINSSITGTQSIIDSQTLVSPGKVFEMGFFSPSNSSYKYLGIWFHKVPNQTVVWVANRKNPCTDSSGMLKIEENQNLVLLSRSGSVVWSSSSSNHSKTGIPVVAQLLDSGNLVLRYEGNNDPENYIWQSFDYPSDTLLEGMKLGWNLKTGLSRYMTSWKYGNDPSPGDFTTRLDPRGLPQLVVRKGLVTTFRTGPWIGLRYNDSSEMKANPVFIPTLSIGTEEVYYLYTVENNLIISRLVLNSLGELQRFVWNDKMVKWNDIQNAQKDDCDAYNLCGNYGLCNINHSPLCDCLKGFIPKSPQDWNQTNWSGGCRRRTQLSCGKGDGFVKVSSVKSPDTSKSYLNGNMTLKECEVECLKNCSCVAYANSDIREGGSGCLMWFGNLLDTRVYEYNGQDLYIRLAASEVETYKDSKKRGKAVAVTVSIVVGVFVLGSIIYLYSAIIKQRGKKGNSRLQECTDYLELPVFHFLNIARATNNFSSDNKLGEGGFGPVYKGKLFNGTEIAVKRFSKKSLQGINEFHNEIILIAKLQHRNLVKILGYCIERQETMLIYEYLPNKSLDLFIFDQAQCTLINWEKRLNIVIGIAQGLLYLHRDSRLRIIHRDLKASNVLLDSVMNPKISDFGIARTFGGDQTEGSTEKVVGTYGYMSPEYAIEGLFSVKSDVSSFGVLVLEIVSGKKNRGFEHHDHDLNLLGHAWKLWDEGKASELLDASIGDPSQTSKVLRYIQVGLLCVQQRPEDRPNMANVVLMLSSDSVSLPRPKQPGFFNERSLVEENSSSSGEKRLCSNDITVTDIQGRE